MTIGGGFVRVYYSILEDPKFVTIYEDDRHLAAWLRLLIVADEIWPSYPPIPAHVRRASFTALVSVGLIDKLPKQTYRIHGLDTERMRRSQHARNAAAMRWQHLSNPPALPEHPASNAPGNAVGNAQLMPRTRAPSPSPSPSPSPIPPDPPEDGHAERLDGPIAYFEATGKYPPIGSALHEWVGRLAEDYTPETFQAALATELTINRSPKDLLSRTESRLARAVDQARPNPAKGRHAETRRELEAEDERRVRLLSRPMKPLRDLMPDVKLGKAP